MKEKQHLPFVGSGEAHSPSVEICRNKLLGLIEKKLNDGQFTLEELQKVAHTLLIIKETF